MAARDEGSVERLIRSVFPFEIQNSHLTVFAIISAAALALLWPVDLVGLVDARMFNYFNNSNDTYPLIYLNRWVSLYPTSIAYSLRDLPFIAQAALYLLVPVGIVIVLQQELQKFLEVLYRPLDAVIFSFIILFSVRLLCEVNLTWSIWPAYVAAGCYILRKNILLENYTIIGVFGLGLICLSNPSAVTFIPILLFYSIRRRRTASAWLNIALVIAMASYYFLMNLHKPVGLDYVVSDPEPVARQFLSHFFGPHRYFNIVAITAAAVLTHLIVESRLRPPANAQGRTNRELILGLAFIGLSSLALYLASFRFSLHVSFLGRYTMMCVASAELAALCYFAAVPGRLLRDRLVAGALLIDVASAAMVFRSEAHRSLQAYIDRYSYFVAAADFRHNCRQTEALAYDSAGRSLVVLCEKRQFDQRVNLVPGARLLNGNAVSGTAIPKIVIYERLL